MFDRALQRGVFGLLAIIGSFFVSNSVAWSQVQVDSLEEMRTRVSVGDKIVLIRTNGESVAGRLQRFGDHDVEIQTEINVTAQRQRMENVTTPFDAIRSLDRKRNASKGTRIGLGAGVGLTAVLFASAYAKDANEVDEWGSGYIVLGALLAGGGALIGRALDHSKPHVRYESSTATTWRLQASPIYSADRRGVKVAFRF